jgi:hypothetical protein
MRAKYEIMYEGNDLLLLNDLAEQYDTMSITNDAEGVIEHLTDYHNLSNSTLVYYVDTMGCVDQLQHKDGEFTKFKSGFDSVEDFYNKFKIPTNERQ